MIELKLNGIDENLTLKRENQYSKKDLDDAVQKAQDAAVLSETSADIAIDAKDDALESANNALLSAQSAKEDADRAERAAEKAEGLPLSSKETGNPLKLESTEAPIIDFKLDGFTHVSSNIWDEECLSGYYDANGNYVSANNQLCTKNFTKVNGGENYFATIIGTSSASLLTFDENKNIIERTSFNPKNSFTVPSNCKYIKINFSANYGASYKNDIAIVEGTSGTYEPYGISALGQKYGCVDLGSLTWAKSTNYFYANVGKIYKVVNANTAINAFCDRYKTASANAITNGVIADAIGGTNDGYIVVSDMSYSTANDFKASVQGLKLYYPIAENAIPSEYAIRVDEVGKNLWDEEWESGAIDNNGNKTNSTTTFRSKNYIKLNPNTSYHFVYNGGTDGNRIYYYFYDNNMSYISSNNFGEKSSNITSPSNAEYMLFRSGGANPAKTYNNDIAILEGTSGEYTPYQGQTVFIPTLNPLQDGDYIQYHVDGTGVEHRKMGVVDLGSLDWAKQANGKRFVTKVSFNDIKKGTLSLYTELCRTEDDEYAYAHKDTIDFCVTSLKISNDIAFYGCLDIYEDAISFKSAMSGVMLVYEKEEPTDTALTSNQIAELKKLKTYKGETNISTEELGSMDITYYADNANAEVVADIQRQVNEKESGRAELPYYDYEEHVVGYWIDGTPIYRKCYDINSSLSTSAVNVASSITNINSIKYIVDAKGIRYNTPLIANLLAWKESNTSFKLYAQAQASNVNLLVLEYTKIGDTPRSSQPMLLGLDELNDAITEPNNSDTI